MKKIKLTQTQTTALNIVILGVTAAVIVLILGYFPTNRPLFGFPAAPAIDNGMTPSQHYDELEEPVATVAYSCAEGKTFTARIEVKENASQENPGHAEVFLNDGSKMYLTQTISGSGVRYANSGESFVFWTKGSMAFIEEGELLIYQDCEGTAQ